MYIVIFASLLALYFTYLESRNSMKNGMKWGFILVTFLAVIHYDYGNDYMSYYHLYEDVVNQPFNLRSVLDGDYYHEPGWVLLCFVFKYLGGFFALVAVLSIVQAIIIYKFIKSEVSPKNYTTAVFIYLFVTSFYLLGLSMLRQWFVACVFLGLWPLIKKRKWLVPLIVLFLCTFIHSSSRVLLPFAFWGFLPLQKSKKIYAVFLTLFIILLSIFAEWANDLFADAISLTEGDIYIERYGTNNVDTTIGIGFIIQLIPFFVGLNYFFGYQKHPQDEYLMVALSILGFALLPIMQISPAVGRLGIYFSIFQITTLPTIYGEIRDARLRIGLWSLFVIVTLFNYYIFFTKGVYVEYYHTFKTIFPQIF